MDEKYTQTDILEEAAPKVTELETRLSDPFQFEGGEEDKNEVVPQPNSRRESVELHSITSGK